MKIILVLFSIIILAAKFSSPAKVFSCDQGCKDDSECPNNSHCVAVNQNSECGMCLCKAGFRTSGSDCVPNKADKDKNAGSGGTSKETTTTTTEAVTSTTVAVTSRQSTARITTSAPASTLSTTVAGTTTQGPPPAPAPIRCADFNCGPTFPTSSDSDNPFTVRAFVFNETDKCKTKLANPGRPCKMQGGGGVCYGVYCLTVEPGNEYCICEYNRVDRQCAVDKPGKCDSATSQLPQDIFKARNMRFRSKSNPENGAIFARHFAASLDDCIKLCTWTAGSCRSINYGPVAGQQVCELLSTAVTKGSILQSWLVDANGWTHVQVVK